MSLQWQTVELSLGVSQDESITPFTLPPQLLQALKNARVYKNGSVGKRPGWLSIATGQTFDRVITVDDQLFTLRQHNGSVTQSAVGLGTVNAGLSRIDMHSGAKGSFGLSEVEVLERHTLMRDVMTLSNSSPRPDFAVSANHNLAVIAWEAILPAAIGAAQNVIMAMVIDVATRQPVLEMRQISTGSGPNSGPYVVMSDPDTAVVVYARYLSSEIRAVAFNCTALTWGADTVLAANLNTTQPKYDVAEKVGGTGYYICYRDTTPVVRVTACTGVTAGTSASMGEDANAGLGAVGVYADATGNNLWVAWYDSTNGLRAGVRLVTNPATVTLANTTMEAVTDSARQITWAPTFGSPFSLIWTTDGLATSIAFGYGRKQTKFRTLTNAGVKGTQYSAPDCELISKAYTSSDTGYTYAAVVYDGSDANPATVPGQRSSGNQVAFTMCICDTLDAQNGTRYTSFRCAATWAIGEAGRARFPSSLSTFRPVNTGHLEHWFMLGTEFEQLLAGAGPDTNTFIGRQGVDICRQHLDAVPRMFGTRLGNNIVFSGGVPQVWDGANVVEYGFLSPPENSLGVDAGAGGTLSAGSYGVQLTWEYKLATGDVMRSAPALVRSSTAIPAGLAIPVAALNDRISLIVPNMNLTRKWNETSSAEGIIARAYRTEANGTLYYAEGDFSAASGFAASFPFATVRTIIIDQPDANAITHAELYTTDGILPNFPPPALSFICTHRNRLFGVVAENRRQIAFTHEYVQGELPGWHPDLVIDVPDDVVGMAAIDEKLVILAKNGVFLIAGNGPDRKGLNSDYDQPFRLNSPHGCMTAESIVSFPNGVLYQAPTGLCLLDRQTTITRVSAPVEDTLAAFPYCHASVVLEDREWVYWSVTDGYRLADSTDGRVIVFDWRKNIWSVDQVLVPGEIVPLSTYVTSFGKANGQIFASVSAVSGVLQHTGVTDPGNQWIFTYLKTAPINLGSASKYQRALGIHQLVVTVTTTHHANTLSAAQQFYIWTNTTLAVLPDYALKMHVANQVGAFVTIEIADGPDPSFPTLADNSASFTTLAIEVGMKRGTQQVAQNATE